MKLLEEKGFLLRIYTQNIDTLERVAGISQEKIVEVNVMTYMFKKLKHILDLRGFAQQGFKMTTVFLLDLIEFVGIK